MIVRSTEDVRAELEAALGDGRVEDALRAAGELGLRSDDEFVRSRVAALTEGAALVLAGLDLSTIERDVRRLGEELDRVERDSREEVQTIAREQVLRCLDARTEVERLLLGWELAYGKPPSLSVEARGQLGSIDAALRQDLWRLTRWNADRSERLASLGERASLLWWLHELGDVSPRTAEALAEVAELAARSPEAAASLGDRIRAAKRRETLERRADWWKAEPSDQSEGAELPDSSEDQPSRRNGAAAGGDPHPTDHHGHVIRLRRPVAEPWQAAASTADFRTLAADGIELASGPGFRVQVEEVDDATGRSLLAIRVVALPESRGHIDRRDAVELYRLHGETMEAVAPTRLQHWPTLWAGTFAASGQLELRCEELGLRLRLQVDQP
jgi:hypothetical protein